MSNSSQSLKWLVLIAIILIAIGIFWWLLPLAEWMQLVVGTVKSLGVWGIVVYFILYVGLASFSFPTTPLNVAAGIIFSFATAAILAIVAAFTSSMITFIFARHYAADWVRKRIRKLPNGDALLESINDKGLRVVFLSRLNPFIPASIKNYGFGVTKIPFQKYALGTIFGQIPMTLTYVYLGWAGGHAMMMGDNRPDGLKMTLMIGGVLLSLILLFVITWQGKKSFSTE